MAEELDLLGLEQPSELTVLDQNLMNNMTPGDPDHEKKNTLLDKDIKDMLCINMNQQKEVFVSSVDVEIKNK